MINLLNPIAYGILSFSQLQRITPENKVKIVWLTSNLVQLIIGTNDEKYKILGK